MNKNNEKNIKKKEAKDTKKIETKKNSSFKKKKKVKKNITSGIAYVYSTFNNTIISIADESGNVVSWSSAGAKGLKVRENLHLMQHKLQQMMPAQKHLSGLRTLKVHVKGPGSGRETALRSLQSRGFKDYQLKTLHQCHTMVHDHLKRRRV